MKLLAFDYSNLIIRHAMNPYGSATDLLGRPVGGPVGAAAQILRMQREHRPSHMLIGRDSGREGSERVRIDPAYKAHRPDADPEITRQFKLAYELAELLRWPVRSAPGLEADDVIATAAKRFPGEVIVVSGDKDMLALCSERVAVALLRPGEVMMCGPDQCKKLLGVSPQRVCDYKALVGDSSDGIGGVRGIGAKTALALLGAYGSLESLLEAAAPGDPARIEGVGVAMAKRLIAGADDARRSYELARLRTEIALDVESLSVPELPHEEGLRQRLRELGLSDLEPHLFGGRKRAVRTLSELSEQEQAALFEA